MNKYKYKPIKKPWKIKDFVIETTSLFKNSKKMILFIQGGPSPIVISDESLTIKDVPQWLKQYYFDMKEFINFWTNNKKIKFGQILLPINLKEELQLVDDLSLDNAHLEVEESLDIIHFVLSDYQRKGWEIILFGHSLGGSLILKYLAKYKNNFNCKFVVANSRLDTPLFIADNMNKNNPTTYLNLDGDIKQVTTNPKKSYHRLFPALTLPRYTKCLEDIKLHNLLFVSSYGDIRFGQLNNFEINFLKAKKSQIIEIGKTELLSKCKTIYPQQIIGFLSHKTGILLPFMKKYLDEQF